MGGEMNITKLAQEIQDYIAAYHSGGYSDDWMFLQDLLRLSEQLAQAAIDMPGRTLKGVKMPQTPEEFEYMATLYEEALLKEKEENSYLRVKCNDLEQKLGAAINLVKAIREEK